MSVEEARWGAGSAPNLADDPFVALSSPPAATRSVEYRMRFALHAAVLAPSVHNTQPWRFRIYNGRDPYVDLLMDQARELPVLDPAHRQLVISCGAALAAYRIGLRSCGLEPQVEAFPADGGPACLARIRVTERAAVDPAAVRLLPSLAKRRSYRGAMTAQPVPEPLQDVLGEAVAAHGFLHFVPAASWRAVEGLIVEAALELAESSAVDDEVRMWTRLTERTHDGIPAANWQRTSEQTAGAPVVQRDFAQGRPLPAAPTGVTMPALTVLEGDPLLAVLLTPTDTAADWMEAGQALLGVALAAEARGLALGYVDQPTEVPGLRERVVELMGPTVTALRVPQLVLRLGYAAQPMPPATPRRPVQSVLVTG